jgi:hypothetical protein
MWFLDNVDTLPFENLDVDIVTVPPENGEKRYCFVEVQYVEGQNKNSRH